MEFTVRKIRPGSAFRVAFLLHAVLGLFGCFFYALFFFMLGQIGDSLMGRGLSGLLPTGASLSILMVFVVGIPASLFYAFAAAVMTALLAILYNQLSSSIGGLRVVLEATPSPATGLNPAAGSTALWPLPSSSPPGSPPDAAMAVPPLATPPGTAAVPPLPTATPPPSVPAPAGPPASAPPPSALPPSGPAPSAAPTVSHSSVHAPLGPQKELAEGAGRPTTPSPEDVRYMPPELRPRPAGESAGEDGTRGPGETTDHERSADGPDHEPGSPGS